MSEKKPERKDPHYAKGVAPQEVRKLAAFSFGFMPKEELKEEAKESMSAIERLRAAAKAE